MPVLLALMLLIAVSGLPATAAGAIFYVDGSATGSANGDSWANAFTALQDALQVATSGDEIRVAQGTYYPDVGGGKTDNDESASFTIPAGVQLYGGFPSGGESAGTRDWQIHKTVLSGDIGQDDTADGNGVVADVGGISGRNSYHVLYLDGTATAITATTVIDGFVVTAGNANGDEFATRNGGGLFCQGDSGECSPTITKVIFSGNAAGDSGGAVKNNGYRGSSNPSFVDVIFRGNSANYGGALHNDGRSSGVSSPSLVNVVFSGNSATNWGGAIVNEATSGTSSPTLTNVILWQNSAPEGASFYNNNADLAILNSVLEGGDSDIVTEGLSNITSSGNSQGDPLFIQPVDPADAPTAGGDLRLQAGSSAINGGDNSVVPTGVATDLAGKLRIVGGTVDMGAHEFVDNHNAYLYFDGSNQYAEFSAPPNLASGSVPRTVAFWLRSNLRDDAEQKRETVVALGTQTDDGSAFGLFTQRAAGETQLCFGAHNAEQCNLAIIPDDQWHFVAITYDEPHLTTYLDGEWQSRHEISTATDGQQLDTATEKGFIGGSPDRGWYFDGGIKNLSIWNTVRSAFQIRQEMAAFPPINGNESGLAAYFPFSDGGGTKFVDLTGASAGELHNGVLWSKPIDNDPSLTAEGIWFVIQNKSDVDTDYAIPARRQALMTESNGSVVMATIPLTGTYDAFYGA